MIKLIPLCCIITAFQGMIRTNKQGKNQQNAINATKIHTYNYRNAVYQGQVSKENRLRQGKGVIYATDTRHFIVCNQFIDNQLNNHCLFFHTHSRYHYGFWKQNSPEGIGIFRMNEVLIVAEYQKGILSQNSKILLVFQKYSTGIIVQTIQDGSWEILQRSDILCNQHLEQLIRECNFKSEPIPYLLIKYLNDFMVMDNSFLKLRLLNNMYYRFGFDQGLAIIFDDTYRLYSVGVHNKNNLTSFGVRYNNERLGNKVEEGIFDGRNTFVFDEPNKPIYKIGQLYCKRHLAEVNFQNQIYKDPSQPYFEYFQGLLSSPLIKNLVGNVLESPTKTKAFYTIMKEQPAKDESLKKYEKLELPEFEIASFKRQEKQNLQISRKRQDSIRDMQTSNILWENSHRSIETFEFEKLSEKNRLDILKKQLYVNLSHKSSNREKEEDARTKRPRIITMSPVDVKNVVRSRRREEILAEKGKSNEPYIYQLPTNWRDISGPNLQKHIDIRINNFVEDKVSRSRSVSKTKKKIFEQCPNVIKDYSPKQSASPSPFKSRMRSKIFSQTPDRTSKSRSRSSTRIFPQKKTPEKIDFNKIDPTPIKEPQSPHMIYDASLEKSQSQSHIKAYPITMTRQAHANSKVTESQNLVNKKDERKQEYRKEQRVRVDDYLALNTPNRKNDLREQLGRRKNEVYRNTMKNQYGDYVFEPISLKVTGNLPYVESTHTLTSNKSCKTIEKSPSKKGILETSPLKREKMSSYMNNTQCEFRQSERLVDFKRRVNYF